MPALKDRNDSQEDQGFSVANDLLNRETGFEERLNRIYGRKGAGSERGSSDVADDMAGAGSNAGDFIKGDGARETSDAQNDVKSKEEAGDDLYGGKTPARFSGRLGGFLKNRRKLSASGTLLGGSLVALISTMFLTGLAAPLVMMERVLTNANAHDIRANGMMASARSGSMMSNLGSDRDCSRVRIMCKVTEMSTKEKKRWEKLGATFESKRSITSPTRHNIKTMTVTLPGQSTPTVITSKDQFNNLVRNNPDFKIMYNKVQHPIGSTFASSSSKIKSKILKKLGIKQNLFKSSKKKDKTERTEEMNKSMDTHTGADPPDTDRETVRKKKQGQITEHSGVKRVSEHAKEKMKGIGFKGGATYGVGLATSAIETACVSYNIVRTVSAVTKLVYYKDLIAVLYPFLQAAGQIVDEGDIDYEATDYLLDRMSWYDKNEFLADGKANPKAGLTFFDSQGMQAAIYGDDGKLQDFTKQYTPWYVTSGVAMSREVDKLQDTFGKENIRTFCLAGKTAGYVAAAAGIGAGAAGCILTFGVGCLVQAGLAIGGYIAGDIAGEKIVEALIETMTSESAERMVAAGLNSDLKGVDLGNEAASAMGILMMQKDMGSGTKPARDASQVSTYLSLTDEYYADYLAMEQQEAQQNPLDPYSQYTFLGQIVSAFNTYKFSDSSGFSYLSNIGALATKPFSILNQTAHAGYHQPIEMVRDADTLKKSLSRSEDADMARIGALSDWQGRSINIVEKEPISWAKKMEKGDVTPWYDTITYMMSGNYIDADGKPIDYEKYKEASEEENDYDNDYLMYKAYCTEDRVYALGTSITPIDDYGNAGDKAGWKDGGKCLGNNDEGQEDPKLKEKLNRFFFYYNMCETQMGIANGNQKCWEDEDTEASTQAPVKDVPAESKGTIALDPGHSAVDIKDTEPATGAMLWDYPNSPELEDMWDVASRVKTKLEAEGYTVKMLRNSIGERVNFQERADRAKGSALAISIHSTPSGGSQVGPQTVGGFRSYNGKTVKFQNADTASLSQKYASAMAKARSEKEGGAVDVRGFNFDGRGGNFASGNMPWVQLLSPDTPWIYNEVQPAGGGGGSSGTLPEAVKNSYAEGIVAGVLASGIAPGGDTGTTDDRNKEATPGTGGAAGRGVSFNSDSLTGNVTNAIAALFPIHTTPVQKAPMLNYYATVSSYVPEAPKIKERARNG